jgi:hypothetical protein
MRAREMLLQDRVPIFLLLNNSSLPKLVLVASNPHSGFVRTNAETDETWAISGFDLPDLSALSFPRLVVLGLPHRANEQGRDGCRFAKPRGW